MLWVFLLNMNKKYLFLGLVLMGVLVMSVSLASAALCQNSKGYYEDCDKNSYSGSKYKTFDTADYDKPVFKGSYGNYRYEMYRNNDYNPNRWFQPSYSRSSGPYFSGGYYGGYGGGYRSYGGYGYYRPSYSGYFSYFWY